jgi:hypothetical protein
MPLSGIGIDDPYSTSLAVQNGQLSGITCSKPDDLTEYQSPIPVAKLPPEHYLRVNRGRANGNWVPNGREEEVTVIGLGTAR